MTTPFGRSRFQRGAMAAAVLFGAAAGAWTPATAQDLLEPSAPRTAPPAEVAAFVKRLAGCNRWAGEEASDAERGTAIAQARFRLRCNTIEQDENRLRARYAKSPGALEALDNAGSGDD